MIAFSGFLSFSFSRQFFGFFPIFLFHRFRRQIHSERFARFTPLFLIMQNWIDPLSLVCEDIFIQELLKHYRVLYFVTILWPPERLLCP